MLVPIYLDFSQDINIWCSIVITRLDKFMFIFLNGKYFIYITSCDILWVPSTQVHWTIVTKIWGRWDRGTKSRNGIRSLWEVFTRRRRKWPSVSVTGSVFSCWGTVPSTPIYVTMHWTFNLLFMSCHFARFSLYLRKFVIPDLW